MASLKTATGWALLTLLFIASEARAQPIPQRPRELAQEVPDCKRLLLDAATALRSEQYPSMSQIAAERQRECPGPESLFLLGIARANMVHKGLVAEASEMLVRAQAIHALRSALDGGNLRGEWLQPANAWLQYLQRDEREQPRAAAPPETSRAPAPMIIPPAAPPFEREPSHLGPLLLASAGIGLLGAGLVTAIIAGNQGPYDDPSTLETATNVLVLTGGVSLVSALTWHLLTPRPDDKVQVTFAGHVSRTTAAATLRMSF